jgi:hypothetical protein
MFRRQTPPPNPNPPAQSLPVSSASSTASEIQLEPRGPEPPIHDPFDLVLATNSISRRHSSRRMTSSRSLSLFVYCPNGHMMRPLLKTGGEPQSQTNESKSGGESDQSTRAEESIGDLENQLGVVSPTSHCHGTMHHENVTPRAVEYHCDACQYFLCEDCYTAELKRLNNLPTRKKSTDRASDRMEERITTSKPPPPDLEMGYGVRPTESGDSTADSTGEEGRGRGIETMSVQVEVDDSHSTKSLSEFVDGKPIDSNLLHQLSSEDALSDQDHDTLSSQPFLHPFRLLPSHLLTVSSPRKMSVGGMTYSSLDSDSLKDDDSASMSHFRVDGQIPLHENSALEDDMDDNMTSSSTIRSGSIDVSSLLPLRRGVHQGHDSNLTRRRLSHRSQDDNQSSVGGGGHNSTTSAPQSDDEDREDGDCDSHRDDDGQDSRRERGDDDGERDGGPLTLIGQLENIKVESDCVPSDGVSGRDGVRGGGDEQIEERSVSDGEIDNETEDEENMSIGSIDSTKCYPNNLYHSKGFLTIASLHKTDSPSGYLTHHLSAIPTSSTLRYHHTSTSNIRRNKLPSPSPSQSHINSPLIEEAEEEAHVPLAHPQREGEEAGTGTGGLLIGQRP